MRAMFLLGGLVLLAVSSPAADPPLWTWEEPDTELYQPAFSPDGKAIAVVRKRHLPDGAEAEMLEPEELEKRNAPVATNERYADPEIVVLEVGRPAPKRVDWGWSPAFSPDGSQIAYAFQKNPLSRHRILAETMAGNDIRLFARGDGKIRVLAEPKAAYLDGPVFSPDGQRVIYAFAGAVNGAYGGEVGIGQAVLDGTPLEPLYLPAKDFDLPHLVSSPLFLDGRVLIMRSQPLAAGVHLSEAYRTELLDLGPPVTSLYTWKGKDPFAEVRDFAITPDKRILIFDGEWFDLKTGPGKKPAEGPTGSLSPDARLMAVITEKGIDVVERETGRTLRQLAVAGAIQGAAWSADSSRLAVVGTRSEGERFLTDVLQVFTILP